MKRMILSLLMTLATLSLVLGAADVDARRLGGGGSSGMQRSVPSQRAAPQYTAPQQAAPMPAPTMAPAAPRRSWLGPLAGVAAGFGLAALFSHFGMGGEMSSLLSMLLFAVIAVVVVRWLLARFGTSMRPQPAGTAFRGNEPSFAATPRSLAASGNGGPSPARPPERLSLPPDFDRAGFERAAKLIFIRMQTANDAGDLNDLRQFTTPEMFAAARLDLQERQGRQQKTDVVQLNAEVIDLARENGRDVVSVRYRGLIREEEGIVLQPAEPQSFDELWHLVRPADGSADWALAGIAQTT